MIDTTPCPVCDWRRMKSPRETVQEMYDAGASWPTPFFTLGESAFVFADDVRREVMKHVPFFCRAV